MRKEFNFSSLTTARKCQVKYFKDYIEIRDKPPITNVDFQYGHAIHAGCEAYLEGDDGVKTFQIFWDRQKTQDEPYGRYSWSELADKGRVSLERFKRLHLGKFSNPLVEQTLTAEFEGVKFYGTPDVMGDFEGVPSIIDFKTSAMRYNRNKILAAEQLYGYSYLAEHALGYKAEQLVYVILTKEKEPTVQIQKTPIMPEIKHDVMRVWAEEARLLLDRQKNSSYTANRQACVEGDRVCPYFNECYKEPKDE